MKKYKIFLTLISIFSLIKVSAVAQITPDNSLPNNSTILKNGNEIIINGGTEKGKNLFHSFDEFSINGAEQVLINNFNNINNIFLRVTGNNISYLNGTLKTIGSASLFFMNQNGISFGSNVSLKIGGSFIATTGGAISFEDGTYFYSKISNTPAGLLTISRPIGLAMFEHSGSIELKNSGHNLSGFTSPFTPLNLNKNPTGLSILPGNSIILIGNKIDLHGGIITANSSNIELLSVKKGLVEIELSNYGYRSFPTNNVIWNEINLSNMSILNASLPSLINSSDSNVSNISLFSSKLNLNNGSVIISQNESFNSKVGNLKIFAEESIEIQGIDKNGLVSSLIVATTLGDGNSGNIEIETKELIANDGSRIGTRTYGSGKGGDIKIKADNLNLVGSSPQNPFVNSAITSNALSEGNSGSIFILSKNINITGGGIIGSVSLNSGNGGNVVVKAENIYLSGTSSIAAPSSISGTAFNAGNAGDIKINSSEIFVLNGAAITTTSSVGIGKGGNIEINAENIVIDGLAFFEPDLIIPSGISSSVITSGELVQNFFETTSLDEFAFSGSIKIITNNLTISNRNVESCNKTLHFSL